MPKAVSATEAKNRFGSLIGYVTEQQDEVIVESQGKPKAVLLSYAAYQEIEQLREEKRRADALASLRDLGERIATANRNSDLSEEAIDALAEEISQDAITRLVERGELTFERDQR
jgi:prevent-host-death family protein